MKRSSALVLGTIAGGLFLAGSASLAAAQAVQPRHPEGFAGPMVTDRPDFTESTEAVPRGRFQLEAGYTFVRRRGPDEHSVGEALLRYGFAERWELRIEAPSLVFESDPYDAGLSDLGIGLKHELAEQDGARPALGLIVSATLPTGSEGFSEDTVVPQATLAWAYDLTERLSLGGNFNLAAPRDEDERFLAPSSSLALGLALAEKLGVFAEYFGFYPSGDRDETHYGSAGLTYLFTPNFQLDFRVGIGLNSAADDGFAGTGFSLRW